MKLTDIQYLARHAYRYRNNNNTDSLSRIASCFNESETEALDRIKKFESSEIGQIAISLQARYESGEDVVDETMYFYLQLI
ncbi:MAG: hypothetical protein SAJ12_24270 [Jaaginema sp. PMC 1079.18]|nr:hypothetical protein [Jaaginema sp. PMC 1080.18]MEC4854110.1 hypothetical protein [Jaaginema sp. PMC 1079.18]MEC4867019.1 hypothetical protein [Jaaginema sp. PMC 1078.18]